MYARSMPVYVVCTPVVCIAAVLTHSCRTARSTAPSARGPPFCPRRVRRALYVVCQFGCCTLHASWDAVKTGLTCAELQRRKQRRQRRRDRLVHTLARRRGELVAQPHLRVACCAVCCMLRRMLHVARCIAYPVRNDKRWTVLCDEGWARPLCTIRTLYLPRSATAVLKCHAPDAPRLNGLAQTRRCRASDTAHCTCNGGPG